MELISKIECTACTACLNSCPKRAITMKRDFEGFLYPEIVDELCIDCGICQKVCPIRNSVKKELPIKVLAAKNKCLEIRKKSTSGGMFSVLASKIIKDGGYYFGAVIDKDMNVCHKGSDNEDEIEIFRGSKYTQSDLKKVFQDVRNILNNDSCVLFTGTPCQCAGLKRYLDINHVNTKRLILCDLICHGVPSPRLWKDHMDSLIKRHGSIKEYQCRSKVKGWHNHIEYCEWKNGKVEYGTRFVQKHKNIFYTNLGLRPSCTTCKYATIERVSDFTIADYWGIENTVPSFDDNDGVSLVLINTIKGQTIISEIEDEIDYVETSIEECMKRQPNLQHPTLVDYHKREKFWEDYQKKGYMYCCRKYTEYGIVNWLKKQKQRVKRKLKLL